MKIFAVPLLFAAFVAAAQSPVVYDNPPKANTAPLMSRQDYQQQKRITDALLLLQSNRTEARKILFEIIADYERQYPAEVAHRRMSGQTEGENANYRTILKSYNPIIVPPPYIKAIGLLASSYLDEGDLANAEKYIVKATITAPYNSLYHTMQGLLELRKTYPAVATNSFILAISYAGMRADADTKALVTQIDQAMGYEGLAEAALMQGDRKRAIEMLEKAIKAYPAGRSAPERLRNLKP